MCECGINQNYRTKLHQQNMADCADKITYAMMPVSGSKISSPHWDFVVELEYQGFVKLSIHQGNPTAISSALWTLCRHMSPTATT